MKITTIIPFYNRIDLVHRRLREVSAFLSATDEIILVDDCSSDMTNKVILKWWQDNVLKGRLRYFRNETNLGFGGSMNVGAKIAIKNGADAVVLLSNDVEVKNNYNALISVYLENSPNTLLGARYLATDTGWNVLPGCGVVPYLEGFFLACTKGVWERLGGFDKGYGKFDYEDVDLSTVAWCLGIKLDLVPDLSIRHMGGQTIGAFYPDRVKYTEANEKYWVNKWSDRAAELKEKIYGVR